MYGFRCAQFPKPEYTLLQRLRKDVLGDGCTQRADQLDSRRADLSEGRGVRRSVVSAGERVPPSRHTVDLTGCVR